MTYTDEQRRECPYERAGCRGLEVAQDLTAASVVLLLRDEPLVSQVFQARES